MTKRDFFRLLIKIFGLYSLIITLFTFIPQNISNVFIYRDESWIQLVIVGSVILLLVLFYILLFKADYIIDKLELDKGFDTDTIVLGNFSNEQILKLAIILIGGFLLIDYFPNFLFEIIAIFKMKVSNHGIMGNEVNYFSFSTAIINLVLGLILITNYKRISLFLDKK
ncbi:hypothetical protein [Flavobacterium sp. NRK F7]|uniref:hypothetical protein n=1 Tax=Flavobacterium sp. NRK F7 TaxID=2954930 RepID=UPI0020915BEB|nr:hypothetical protein [Flavobacterium sp. NRK F7]MCO6163608.1 hypothetical protein [Flavobacterium sp. NRK F7]